MNEKQKKKNTIIGISIGIFAVLLVVISSTYAYWQITKSQEDPNQIVAACLDFDVNFPVGITEENKWPMSSSDAMSKVQGYTFTVTNNCPEDVTYVVGLESVISQGITEYLLDSSVGIGFDGVDKGTYASLTDLEGPTANARESKKLQTAIVKGYKEGSQDNVNTHNLKLWIDESSNSDEQSKGFSAKLFITGGQKIENDMPNELTAESCFEMDTETGTEIIGYDESCGDSVVIPAEVNGVVVKTIDSNAFKGATVTKVHMTENGIQDEPINTDDVAFSLVCNNYPDYGECPEIAYAIIYDLENKDSLIETLTSEDIGLTSEQVKLSTDTLPQKENMQAEQFHASDFSIVGATGFIVSNRVVITSLDLSQAHNIEEIEPFAFTNLTDEDIENDTSKPAGLTNLNFGKNTNKIRVGRMAFAGIDVDELIFYTTYHTSLIYASEISGVAKVSPFMNAEVGKLKIMATADKKVVDDFSINEDIKVYYNYPFAANMNIDEVEIDESVIGLAVDYFRESKINKLILQSNLKSLNDQAYTTTKINKLTIPASVKTIGEKEFSNCDITNLVFEDTTEKPSQLEIIGANAFENIKATSLVLPSSLKTIESAAFNRLKITTLTIPSSVETIGDMAFGHNIITNLTFEDTAEKPSQLKSIELDSFQRDYGIENGNVKLPTSTTLDFKTYFNNSTGWNVVE